MRRALIIAGSLVVAGCLPTSGASTGDVPTYRGDSGRTGVMPGPGPSGEPRIAWQFQADSLIRSSPTVSGGAVFVSTMGGLVHALELSTGAERWRSEVGAELGAATPLVIDGAIVVGDRDGVVHALDPQNGAERWRATVDGPIAGAAADADGSIVVATESASGYRMDPSSGEIAWRSDLPGGVSRSIAATDELVYCAVSGGGLVALRTSDGTVAWQAEVASSGAGGTPTIAGGLVYAATGLDSDDPATRGLVALDARTGEERWRLPSPTGEVMYAPAVADGSAYIVAEDESVTAVDAETGKVRWSTTTGSPNDALPSVWGDTVYVATTGGALQALDTLTGTLDWEVPIRGVPYAPVVTGGLVLVGTNAGVLYALGSAAR
jgi:eukaryotic-like serine/threonine-protein kinase